jgi:methionyl-tRNA formyltransferase
MRCVFMGSPAFAVPSLEALAAEGHQLLRVVTQPTRPAGRGLVPRPTAVARLAERMGLSCEQPQRLAGYEHSLAELRPDVLVVVAYGRLLRKPLLELAPHGAINVHASLLPRWRGAAPVAHAIMAGDEQTGVSIMQLDEGMDTGPVYASERLPIERDDTTGSLEQRLSVLGARLLCEVLEALERQGLEPTPQPREGVTMAPRIVSEQARIDWSQGAARIDRLVRAMQPRPCAWTLLRGRRLRVHAVQPVSDSGPAVEPGTLVAGAGRSLLVACGSGMLELQQLQPEGKPRMTVQDLVNGRQLGPGERFGS